MLLLLRPGAQAATPGRLAEAPVVSIYQEAADTSPPVADGGTSASTVRSPRPATDPPARPRRMHRDRSPAERLFAGPRRGALAARVYFPLGTQVRNLRLYCSVFLLEYLTLILTV